MAVVTAYEESRGASITDVSQGRDLRLHEALQSLGHTPPRVASADLISSLTDDTRFIEVKGRGSSGPIKVIERERDTFEAAREASWLYVVWNTTQPGPFRLFTVQDPQRLPWVQTQSSVLELGTPRGARHEAKFECQSRHIEDHGVEVDLTGLTLPEKPPR